MDDLRAASTLVPLGGDRFAWDVPDGWQQGKGAFGGLVIATLARAIARGIHAATARPGDLQPCWSQR